MLTAANNTSISKGVVVSQRRKIGFPSFMGIVILASLGVSLPWAEAQSLYGTIHGTVRGPAGEAFSGATVTVTSQEKGLHLRTTTDPLGHYNFSQLQADTYDVRVEAADRSMTAPDVSVPAGEESLVDFQLSVRGQASPVQSASTLKTRSDTSVTLDRSALANLPNFDQNPSRFGFLAPGTQLLGELGQPTFESTRGTLRNMLCCFKKTLITDTGETSGG